MTKTSTFPIKEQTQQSEPASAKSPKFEDYFSPNQIPHVSISKAYTWLGLSLNNFDQLNKLENRKSGNRSSIDCTDGWKLFKNIETKDPMVKGTNARVDIYTFNGKIEVIFAEFESLNHKSCAEDLDAIEEKLSTCKKLKSRKKEFGYQCSKFAMSKIDKFPFHPISSPKGIDMYSPNINELLVEKFDLPQTPMFLHHYSKTPGHRSSSLVFYRNKNFLSSFVKQIRNLPKSHMGGSNSLKTCVMWL